MIGKKHINEPNCLLDALPAKDCLAKLVVDDKTGENRRGITVTEHCRITGYVAEALYASLIDSVKRILSSSAPFFAAIHDVGKLSPDFQRMIYVNLLGNVKDLPQLQRANETRASRKDISFHGKVSQTAIENCFPEQKFLAAIEGMHHGFKPNFTPCLEDADIYGGKNWTCLRHNLIESLKTEFGSSSALNFVNEWNEACVLGGFITVADWIASGGYFGRLEQNHFIPEEKLREYTENAVRRAGFVPLAIKKNLRFEDIFGFSPRQVQSDLFESIDAPGVYVLEAPMGLGKTEAALYAAYKMLEKGLASGIYFGLPTQLTSNKIYERVEAFLAKITDESYPLKLLHSSAWLEDDVLGVDAKVGGSWFDAKKRGILAPFAVGTIDQALMAAMNVKHSMVRAFGLAGKVVILDEVHSYDSYTGTIMNALVDELKHIGCTVIILSATLTSNQKKKILCLDSTQNLSNAYPLITAQEQESFKEISCAGAIGRNVEIKLESDDKNAFEEALNRACDGEQVLWIENTVAEAQSAYKRLAAKANDLGVECGLIHSRFIKKHRAEIEGKWVSLYGKSGRKHRSECGRILVGTQVLEQSIDIDADYLVTRICPMDMVLQRLGRLWRHRENDDIRPKTSKCEASILVPAEWPIKNDRSFGDSGVVYSPYVLCRTMEVLISVRFISLPDDIRSLLEQVYLERMEDGLFAKLKKDLQQEKEKLQNFARIELCSEKRTETDSVVRTRYSEIDTVSVLLLESFVRKDDGVEISFWGESDKVFLPKFTSDEKLKCALSRKIVEHCVVVSEKNAPPEDKNIQAFAGYVYLGNVEDEEKSLFRAVIVDRDNSFRDLNRNRLEIKDDDLTKKMLYTDRIGYQVEK